MRPKFNFQKSREQATKDLDGKKKDPRIWDVFNKKEENNNKLKFVPSNKTNKDGDYGDFLYTKLFFHNFKYVDDRGKDKYYAGVCPSTFGKDCLICERGWELKDSGDEAKEKLGKEMGRGMKYLTNIYILSDPGVAENNGKIFMTKMSPQAFDKVLKAMSPSKSEREKRSFKQIEPYDILNAPEFYYVYMPQSGNDYPHYKDSEFDRTPFPSNEEMSEEEIVDFFMENAFNLDEYVSELLDDMDSDEKIMEGLKCIMLDGGMIQSGTGDDYEDEELSRSTKSTKSTKSADKPKEDEDDEYDSGDLDKGDQPEETGEAGDPDEGEPDDVPWKENETEDSDGDGGNSEKGNENNFDEFQ